jgi:hypothetical protein
LASPLGDQHRPSTEQPGLRTCEWLTERHSGHNLKEAVEQPDEADEPRIPMRTRLAAYPRVLRTRAGASRTTVCQRLYIASRTKLNSQHKTKAAPLLAVQDVSGDKRVRDRFPGREFIYLAGAHVECGCGFPALSSDPGGGVSPVDPMDLRSMRALADHLRGACKRHDTVELYLCWVHEESEAPLSRRTVTLKDLRDDGFRLRHRERLTVGSAP